jgi:hypothetical protein
MITAGLPKALAPLFAAGVREAAQRRAWEVTR